MNVSVQAILGCFYMSLYKKPVSVRVRIYLFGKFAYLLDSGVCWVTIYVFAVYLLCWMLWFFKGGIRCEREESSPVLPSGTFFLCAQDFQSLPNLQRVTVCR